jgi:hypothetical protein
MSEHQKKKPSYLTVECTTLPKSLYVKAAGGKKLANWILETLDREVDRLNNKQTKDV